MLRDSVESPPSAFDFRNGVTSEQLVSVLVIAAFFAVGASAAFQDDSWWHLRTGEFILTSGTVPTVDVLSWVLPPGSFWPNHEWLSQVVLFSVYRIGGFPLVNIGCGVILAAAGVFLFQAMRGAFRVRAALLMLMLPWILTVLAVRPQLFTILFFSIFLRLLGSGKVWPIPLLFLVWVQFHAGVMLGEICLAVSCAAAFLPDRRRALRMLGGVAAGAVAIALNPLGLHIFIFPFESVHRASTLPLDEWRAPSLTGVLDLYFWISAVFFALLAFFNRRRLGEVPAILYVALSLILLIPSIQHLRNIHLWYFVAGVATTHLLAAPRERGTPARVNLLLCGAGVSVAVFLAIWRVASPSPALGWRPVSARGLQALKAMPEPVFNSYNTGGFLMWFLPERKVFIDSRQDPYPLPLLQETMEVQRNGDFGALFSRFAFRSAVVEPYMPLAKALADHGWRETYRGASFVVFLHPEPSMP